MKSPRAGGELDLVEYQECTHRAICNARKLKIRRKKVLVATHVAAAPKRVQKQLKRIVSGKTGSWLTVVPERRNDILLSKEEIRDNLRLCYGMRLISLLQRLWQRVLGGPRTEIQKGRPCLHPAQQCAR